MEEFKYTASNMEEGLASNIYTGGRYTASNMEEFRYTASNMEEFRYTASNMEEFRYTASNMEEGTHSMEVAWWAENVLTIWPTVANRMTC